MKARGFTLIEILVLLVITGIVIGLIWSAFSITRNSAVRRTAQLDWTMTAADGLENVLEQCSRMTGAVESPGADMLRFAAGAGSESMTVTVRNAPDLQEWVMIETPEGGESRERRYSGNIGFQFWNGSEWTARWSGSAPPAAVSIAVTADETRFPGIEPLRVAVNIPAGVEGSEGAVPTAVAEVVL